MLVQICSHAKHGTFVMACFGRHFWHRLHSIPQMHNGPLLAHYAVGAYHTNSTLVHIVPFLARSESDETEGKNH